MTGYNLTIKKLVVLLVFFLIIIMPFTSAQDRTYEMDDNHFRILLMKNLMALDWYVKGINTSRLLLDHVLDCNGNQVLATYANGTIYCDNDDTGGGAGASLWVDGGNFLYPNTSYADNIRIYGWIEAEDWTNATITESQISDLQDYQDDIGSDCSAGDFVKGVDDNGVLDCDTPSYTTDTDTQKNASLPYLYNDTSTIYFNETKLNHTIDLRENDTTYLAGLGLNLSGTTFNIHPNSITADMLTDDYILTFNEGNLNVNSSNYWDNYDDPTGWDLDSSNDLLITDLPLENLTLVHCSNITGSDSNLCTLADTDTNIDKWIDNGTFLTPNGTYASNVIIDNGYLGFRHANINLSSPSADVLRIASNESIQIKAIESEIWGDTNFHDGFTSYDTMIFDYYSNCEPLATDGSGNLLCYEEGTQSIDWSQLSGFPSACPAGQYVTQVGSSLTCSTPAGGGTGKTGGPPYLYNDSTTIYLNETVLNNTVDNIIGENNHSFNYIIGFTSDTYNGNITNGSLIGYEAANAICNIEIPGSHFCLEVEIMKTNIVNSSITGQYWMAKGAPGYTAAANDCEGWTKTSGEIGPFWDYNENSGVGAGKLTPCSSELQLACCGGSI